MSHSLRSLLALLERLAPLERAESWDNVGLLIQAEAGLERRSVSRVLLTIDFTEAVLAEAVACGADLVVAYHPVVFEPLKRLTFADRTGRVALGAVKAGVSVYCPHTALDGAPGGVNDWLVEPFGPFASPPAPFPEGGIARRADLAAPISLDEAVARVKRHLGVERVRVARADDGVETVRSVAVCAGAGGSVLRGAEVDLVLSGEMRHHDVIAHVAVHRHVILCDHTHSERGYLAVFADRLRKAAGTPLDVRISERDREPLAIA
ncbi:MAG TPA: Nif3-like dinuclear metal center hexameric protein [Polyangiaceae bacterium]|jgi:dinuclear metal center YbgI/SA1388 family protein